MNAKEKRVRILDLQDQYCRKCEYHMKPLKDCVQHCEAGRELSNLAQGMFEVNKGRIVKTLEQWDEICQEAATLYNQGVGFTIVAKKLGCHPSTLRDQLKKRGLWKGESQVKIQERSREKWDNFCQQALELRELGLSYQKIANRQGVAASSLRNEMSRRGLR
ncbi:hypothetical protein IGM_04355 [Bacillus cereus HuB4-4]|uniref:Zinc-finger domain-containing protein n=1 Tax=Bacillus cereus HuB4-4 TaxID=1053211 RepID=A0A9W5QS84_BACCE|nr:hypothetical protein [Bacillus cereus]EOP85980.1 hypothetical protein IGM_04355 [Bacillus cereus HuB4-4]